MNSAGLSSICQGTKGLNGSALRAILRTFDAGLAPGVGEVPPVVVVGAQALRSNPAMAAAMTGHRAFRANMSSPSKKPDADGRVELRRPPPARVLGPLARASALSAFRGP